MLIISSARFGQHVTPPGHPERVERAHVFDAVALNWARDGGRLSEPRPATRAQLERVHLTSYLDQLAAVAGQARMLDPDTFTSPDSYDVALLAAGAAVQAAEHAVETSEPAFAFVRPPGHHAERDKAMGFCLINNVAVAAAAMLDRGLSRIAIVDFDVHHGNGTQHMFYRDPRVLYLSIHQYPFYPGTGAATEIGEGDGRGFTANVPMEAGSGDADYALVYNSLVQPLIDCFGPQLLIVSAGYDAHERDPLASMRLTTRGYAMIVHLTASCARRHGALALVTEGGYESEALGACLKASLDTLDDRSDARPWEAGRARDQFQQGSERGARAVSAARSALADCWRGL